MSKHTGWVSGLLVFATVLVASCGGSTGSSTSTPPPVVTTVSQGPVPGAAQICAGDGCDNLDPSKSGSGCDGSTVGKEPISAIPPQPVTVGGFQGTLALHKSNPGVCDLMYWAHVVPTATNTEPFETWVRIGVHTSIRQVSEPGNPGVTAWSAMLHGTVGKKVQACMAVKRQSFCTAEITVVP